MDDVAVGSLFIDSLHFMSSLADMWERSIPGFVVSVLIPKFMGAFIFGGLYEPLWRYLVPPLLLDG